MLRDLELRTITSWTDLPNEYIIDSEPPFFQYGRWFRPSSFNLPVTVPSESRLVPVCLLCRTEYIFSTTGPVQELDSQAQLLGGIYHSMKNK